jgi:hypothetical protein
LQSLLLARDLLCVLRIFGGRSMSNRIGRYFGDARDIDRARDILAFLDALATAYGDDSDGLQNWEMYSLRKLQGDAIAAYRYLGVPLPWEEARKS